MFAMWPGYATGMAGVTEPQPYRNKGSPAKGRTNREVKASIKARLSGPPRLESPPPNASAEQSGQAIEMMLPSFSPLARARSPASSLNSAGPGAQRSNGFRGGGRRPSPDVTSLFVEMGDTADAPHNGSPFGGWGSGRSGERKRGGHPGYISLSCRAGGDRNVD